MRRRLPAVICIFLAGVLGSRCTCEPSEGRFAFLAHWDFPVESYAFRAPLPTGRVPFGARVYYPSEPPDDSQEQPPVAPGLHPLVVFGHGRYSPGAPTNYLGMTNLMHHLASWGYICVSVDLDVLNDNFPDHDHAIPHRGELLLHAVDRMLELNLDASSIFASHVDSSRIVLAGHSRGGGGAISAVNQNFLEGAPRSIRALATISPVDFGVQPLQPAVPHLSIYGTWDGDLFQGQGHRIWDAGTRAATRQFVQVYGANHFYFTDGITYANESAGISREAHQDTARGFINAFLALHVRGLDLYDWNEYLRGDRPMVGGVDSWIQILSEDRLVVDDGGPVGTENTNSLGGSNTHTSPSALRDQLLTLHHQHFYNSGAGLIVEWQSEDRLVFTFPPQDVTGFDALHFRASQVVGGVNLPTPPPEEVGKFKDWKVHVRDAIGNSSFVGLRGQGGLMYPDASGSIDEDSPYSVYRYKSIPRSFRIPLASFLVAPSQVTQIEFEFDLPDDSDFVNTRGAIALDDLEFVKTLEGTETP